MQRSSWTVAGRPLPFVPYDDTWQPGPALPPSYVDLYRHSLATFAGSVPAAHIPVDRIAGEVLLVAGGADALWPSAEFAERIVERRAAAGLATRLVADTEAGHRVVLPGEQPPPARTDLAQGGTPEAAAALGRLAWPVVLEMLGLLR